MFLLLFRYAFDPPSAFRYIMRQQGADSPPSQAEAPSMHLAVVACGDRMEETLTMVKSAVLLSSGSLRLHIFAEEQLHVGFRDKVSGGKLIY